MGRHHIRRPAWRAPVAAVAAVLTVAGSGWAITTLPSSPAPVAQSATDLYKCGDFRYQEDAQAILDSDLSDPHRLDEGGLPGVACEDLPRRGTMVPPDSDAVSGEEFNGFDGGAEPK